MATERLPFEPVLSDKDRKRLAEFKKDVDRTDLLLEFDEYKKMAPVYERRKALTKTIPKFWPVALLRHPSVKLEFEKREDVDAIQYLEHVDIKRDPKEPRAYTLEFTFGRNPYFEDSVLRKEFRYVEPKTRTQERADSEGFKWSMLDFDWEKDVKPQASRIRWKPGKDLSRKYPKEEDDGEVTELGSFFNWFTITSDPFDLGVIIGEEIFPDAIGYFTGDIHGPDSDDDDDDNSDDDDDDDDSD
ncbi:hypothetical protein EUX98_g3845 [Antrodiella citrinella]|uniref:Uncharacterized protein n=1 Tax=Antrodiella citrinella TaxID=2447956 RepID=A0A4S4MWH7_9APHY|nr:hypothetical protein EUX98_g3845 [Antrodiella citrinella]